MNGRIDNTGVVSGCHAGPLPFSGRLSATSPRSLRRCAGDCGDPNSLPRGVGTFLENRMGGTSFYSGAPARSCYVISPNGICSRGSSAVDMSITSSELLRNRQFKRQHFALVANELTKNVLVAFGRREGRWNRLKPTTRFPSAPASPLSLTARQRRPDTTVDQVCVPGAVKERRTCEDFSSNTSQDHDQTSAVERFIQPVVPHLLDSSGCRADHADASPSYVGALAPSRGDGG